jgi:2-amino-4-hydroxy-6-hydroxymethyldihydropteridine diphosphokinase
VVARPTATTDRVAVSRPEVTAYIALGANLGEPAQALRDALSALGAVPGIRLVRASSLYRSAPVDSSGPDYLNAVAERSTTLTAPALLVYGQGCIASPRLTVPHPRMSERAFVLVPLVEIAPTLVSPLQLQGVADQAIEPTGQEWASR